MKTFPINPIHFCCVILIIHFFNPYSASSQTLQDSIKSYFNTIERIPQEKLYLHLDKPFYGAGDTIRFKGYLQNAITHEDSRLSNYFLIELIDRQDSVLQRKKYRRNPEVGFAGHLSLPPDLPAGDYQLRGYSNWMLNTDPAFYYSRKLRIGNSIDISIQSSIEYIQDIDSSYFAQIKFVESGNKPFENTKVRYSVREANLEIEKGVVVTNEYGQIRIPLSSLNKRSLSYLLQVSFDDPTYNYHAFFYPPSFSTDYAVTFFPEGGNLLNAVSQVIAFKAQAANGLSKSIRGKIYTNKGDTLTTFKTEHDGMGSFSLFPSADCLYYADILSSDGIRKQFELPKIQTKGFGISITKLKKGIGYTVQNTGQSHWNDTLLLLAHTRGRIRFIEKITQKSNSGFIKTDFFDEGITHFLLVDPQGIPLSERLCFILHPNTSRWKIIPDKESYGPREKVTLRIEAEDRFGKPISGNFSVSITDNHRIPQDSLSDHIRSTLLLTSDLKGYIESPAYYFFGDRKLKDHHLDLVMLTHGWRRFIIDRLTHFPRIKTEHFVEVSQSISGYVEGLLGNRVKQGTVTAFTMKDFLNQTTTTDEEGRFVLSDINFPDSTRFAIQARTKKGYRNVGIEIDPINFAPIYNKFNYNNSIAAPLLMDNYLLTMKEKYTQDGGMPIIHLKEVEVKANRLGTNNILEKFIDNRSYRIINEKMIDEVFAGENNIFDIIDRVTQKVKSPIFVLDDLIYESNDPIIEEIRIEDIAKINILTDVNAVSLYGSVAVGGAVVIERKNTGFDQSQGRKKGLGIISHSPLGYVPYIEFYHPIYDHPKRNSDSKPDLRTTIYWNPTLCMHEGKAIIEYYTSDEFLKQNIIIEGVNMNMDLERVQKVF